MMIIQKSSPIATQRQREGNECNYKLSPFDEIKRLCPIAIYHAGIELLKQQQNARYIESDLLVLVFVSTICFVFAIISK